MNEVSILWGKKENMKISKIFFSLDFSKNIISDLLDLIFD